MSCWKKRDCAVLAKPSSYQDINNLRYSTWRAPIEKHKDGRTVYYRYADANYSINNQLLNETDVEQLKSAILVLSRFRGLPQFEWINEMIPIIESKMRLVGHQKQAISFDHNLDYSGLAHITPLFNAIVHERVLTISYQDFKSDAPYALTFHPYHLRQYNNRWFTLGYHVEHDVSTWNLALDRIISVEETNEAYRQDTTDWEDYFYDIIGVTYRTDRLPEEVRLLFTPEQAPYIKSKPLHPTQRHHETEAGLEVRIIVVRNYELEAQLLSYGASVEVLSPPELRRQPEGAFSPGGTHISKRTVFARAPLTMER